MFNTFSIDSTATAGSATLAVFYLKHQDSTIYCRIIAESFATERRYCISPVAALFLQSARRHEGRLELVGMDAGHRMARWRSLGYLTPPEIQMQATKLTTVDGIYRNVAVQAAYEETQATVFDGMSGIYREVLVTTTAPPEPGSTSYLQTIEGAYTYVPPATPNIFVDAPDEPGHNTILDTTLTGIYSLVRLNVAIEDNQTARLNSIGGSYAPP
jgi:hypothetical protein